MPAHPHSVEKPQRHTLAVPYQSGEQRFAAIATETGAVWLDSGNASFSRGEFEIIAAQPTRQGRVDQLKAGGDYQLHNSAQTYRPETSTADIFSLIQQLRQHDDDNTDSPLPFHGGVLGYLGYDLNQSLERLVAQPPAPGPFPVAWLGYYPWALVQNIRQQCAWLVADSAAALATAQAQLEIMDRGTVTADDFRLQGPWCESSSEQQHLDAIAVIQRLIEAGDCYQVNLAQHFRAAYRGHPWHAYRRLRRELPSPFSAFINTGHGCLLSHSPERFLHVAGGHISTSPIKGTRPRGDSAASDALLARDLQQSAKDRAENLMIVDLLRNDLGKSCSAGSITAEALFELESYANVHHLVSTISGRLRPEITPIDALRDAFPGGSITGAPKIAAMDIINQLEPVSRSAYCGSVFYYSNHGHLDSSIAIRSLVADGSNIHCWGGGGIVADSLAQPEYAESLAKIEVLLRVLEKRPN